MASDKKNKANNTSTPKRESIARQDESALSIGEAMKNWREENEYQTFMSDYSSKAMVDSGLLDAKKKYNRINSEDYGYNDNQYDADMFDAINELNNAQSNYDAIMKKSRKAFIDLKRGKNNEK